MINDRTGALKAALKENDDENCNVTIENDTQEALLGEFFSQVEEISQCISQIESAVGEVRKKHNAVLTAPQRDEKVVEDIESLTAQIKRLSNKVRMKLKCIEQDIEIENDKNPSSAELRMKTNQLSSLSKQFLDTMSEYNKIQVGYREKCKDQIKRQVEVTGKVVTDDELEEMLGSEEQFSVFTEGHLAETEKAKQTLADIKSRYADILKLETSIKELHEMFMDMAILVENQGELLNHIQYNVENSLQYVKSGSDELKKAEDHQKKARKKKIILIIVLIVILAIIGLIIGLNVK